MVSANPLALNSDCFGERLLSSPLWILDIERQQVWWANHLATELVQETASLFREIRGLSDTLERQDHNQALAFTWLGVGEPLSCWCAKIPLAAFPGLLVIRAMDEPETLSLAPPGRENRPTSGSERIVFISLYQRDGQLLWQDPLGDRHRLGQGRPPQGFYERFAHAPHTCDRFDALVRCDLTDDEASTREIPLQPSENGSYWHRLALSAILPPPPLANAAPEIFPLVLSVERATPGLTPAVSSSLENVLAQVLKALNSILTQDDPQGSLTTTLGLIGNALAADRARWCDRIDLDALSKLPPLRPQAEWLAEGIAPRRLALEQSLHPDGSLRLVYDRLVRGFVVATHDPLIEAGEHFDRLLQDTQSAVILPVLANGQLRATLTLEQVRHPRLWTTRERDILHSAAMLLGNALIRSREVHDIASRDRLLDGVNWANHLLLARGAERYEDSLTQVLQLLGRASGANRTYLLQHRPSGRVNPASLICQFEWTDEGIRSRLGEAPYQALPQTVWQKWLARLNNGMAAAVSHERLPNCLRSPEDPIQAVVLLPLEVEGQLWGSLGFDFRQFDRTWSDTELLILKSAAGSIAAAIARHQASTRLARRDRLLDGVARATSGLLAFDCLETVLDRTIADLGMGSGADTAAIFQKHCHPLTPKPVMSLRYEWVAEGIPSNRQDPYLQNMPYESTFYPLFEMLAGDAIVCDRVENLPDAERSILESYSVRTILLLPVRLEDQLWGFLYFARYHRDDLWTEGEQALLRTAAGNIAAAIARYQAKAELARLNAELEHRIWKRTAELQAANRQLTYNAYHDALTGLPNRALLSEQLEQALAQCQRERDRVFALLCVDLDRFKTINDSLGHHFGDRILVETASRLIACLNHGDLVARLGSDEFAILLRNIHRFEEATRIAERVFASLSRPFHLDDREIYLTASIGIAGGSARYTRPDEILRDADIVMHHAKVCDRDRYQVFDTQMHNHLLERHQIENDFRRATLELALPSSGQSSSPSAQFQIRYQPIVSLSSECAVGFEALVRWLHPQLGFISPLTFIPIAEESGEIVRLGSWVMFRACQQLRQWQEQFPELVPLTMSVNVSARQLAYPQFISEIDRILAETGIQGTQLKLEMTESVLIENDDIARHAITQLRERQIQLCMDDFGTGYSSLSYLHRFSFDTLKIDRTFVSSLKSGRAASPIVQTVIALARNLHMTTVAEGVETKIQQDLLRRLGCEYGQGYLFAPPLDETTAGQALARSLEVGKWTNVDASGRLPQ